MNEKKKIPSCSNSALEELPLVVVVGGVVVVVTFWEPPLFSTIIDFLLFLRLFETGYGLSENRKKKLLKAMKFFYMPNKLARPLF